MLLNLYICKWLVQKDRLDVMNLRYSRLALPPLLQITIAYALSQQAPSGTNLVAGIIYCVLEHMNDYHRASFKELGSYLEILGL